MVFKNFVTDRAGKSKNQQKCTPNMALCDFFANRIMHVFIVRFYFVFCFRIGNLRKNFMRKRYETLKMACFQLAFWAKGVLKNLVFYNVCLVKYFSVVMRLKLRLCSFSDTGFWYQLVLLDEEGGMQTLPL